MACAPITQSRHITRRGVTRSSLRSRGGMMRVGVTGHVGLTAASAPLIFAHLVEHLRDLPRVHGITCLAPGADQLFVSAIRRVGGTYEVILPSAERPSRRRSRTSWRRTRRLLRQATSIAYVPSEMSAIGATIEIAAARPVSAPQPRRHRAAPPTPCRRRGLAGSWLPRSGRPARPERDNMSASQGNKLIGDGRFDSVPRWHLASYLPNPGCPTQGACRSSSSVSREVASCRTFS